MLSRITCAFCLTVFLLLTQGLSATAVLLPSRLRIVTDALPVGIPEPPFGIRETAPETASYCPNWPLGAGGGGQECYYVDSSSAVASDTSNPYGYPNKPRKTIPTSYTAGSYVEIHGGPYTGATLQVNVPGTASLPIWFRGASKDLMPDFQREIVPNGSYAIFENLKFSTVNTASISFRVRLGSASNHMAVRDCLWEGPGTAAIASAAVGSTGDATHQMSYIVVYRNTIHGFGDFSTVATVEQDWCGASPGVYTDHFWFLENHVYDVTGDGVIVGNTSADTTARPRYVFIGGNIFHHNGENAVDIKRSQHVIISQNQASSFRKTSHSAGEGIVAHSNSDMVWILNNTVSDSDIGIITTGSDNTFFLGNVIYNIHGLSASSSGNAAISARASSLVTVMGNTVFDVDTGIYIENEQAMKVKNNIVANVVPSLYHLTAENSTAAASSTMDNNLFFQAGGSARINWGDGVVRTVAGIKSSFGVCPACVEADPLFKAVLTKDFHLRTISPAINYASSEAVYDTFLSLYGVSCARDVDNTLRPQRAAWDIGAYEVP